MALAFWTCIAVVLFAYFGYPAWMSLLALLRPRPLQTAPWAPMIDVLLVVHDAAGEIARKIDNLLALDYPPGQLRINVVCDGCHDDTEAIARAHGSRQLRVFAHPARRGKSACIGSTLPLLDGEIVLFTDVRQRLDRDAARALTAALADPSVGVASGELVLESAAGFGQGVNAYWRYEKLIRRMESASGSLVGVTGAIYAARRNVLPEVPPGLILDDMWIPLSVAVHGLRVVFVPQALAFDRAATDPAAEARRKRRTLAGNFQLLHRWPALGVPGAHPLAWRLWGHKWLRLLVPWLLALALVLNALLASGRGLYAALLAVQLLAYALALAGWLWPRLMALLPIRIASTFLSLNLSAAAALVMYISERDLHLWSATPSRR